MREVALLRSEAIVSGGTLEQFLKDNDGVVSVSELANFLRINEQLVRRWARANNLRRIGSTFVFNLTAAKKMGEEFRTVSKPWSGR